MNDVGSPPDEAGFQGVEKFDTWDGPCHVVTWVVDSPGPEPSPDLLDDFIHTAITAFAAEPAGTARWLEVSSWADSGRLLLFASAAGPFGERAERLQYQFIDQSVQDVVSQHLSSERIDDAIAAIQQTQKSLWRRVRLCLTTGKAKDALAAARQKHELRLAAYGYDPWEGDFQLSDLEPPNAAELTRQLEASRKPPTSDSESEL